MPKHFGLVSIDGTPGVGVKTPWNPGRYEGIVLSILYGMFATKSGKALKEAATRRLRIEPWLGSAKNASASPDNRQDATSEFASLRSCKDGKATGAAMGTGAGSDVTIRFTPADWGPAGMPASQGPGLAADEVLFHEMVHSTRENSGLLDCRPTTTSEPTGFNYDTEEEVIAVIVTNIFSQETGRRLRKDHNGFMELDLNTTDQKKKQEVYYALHERSVLRFCVQQPVFSQALSRVAVPVNPIAVAYNW